MYVLLTLHSYFSLTKHTFQRLQRTARSSSTRARRHGGVAATPLHEYTPRRKDVSAQVRNQKVVDRFIAEAKDKVTLVEQSAFPIALGTHMSVIFFSVFKVKQRIYLQRTEPPAPPPKQPKDPFYRNVSRCRPRARLTR